MANEPAGQTDKDLALWMLVRMQDSAEFLGVLRAARTNGKRDVLDTPEYAALHRGRLKKLYQSDTDDTVETPASLAGAIDEIAARDLLSGREELIEKAIAAYLDTHPKGAAGLPTEWQTTFDSARAEIEGKTKGAFDPGFTAGLATAAREELRKLQTIEKGRDVERDGP
jgi:hypothetical protein